MTTFPTLAPSTRAYTPGEYPHTPFNTISGWQNRVRHSNVMLASQLQLAFTAITESAMLSILSHYQGQYGGYDSFDLPSTVWGGATPADYQLAGYFWRYVAPPVVEDTHYGRYNVELALETVPPDGAAVDGLLRTVAISIAAGVALTTNGLNRTVAVGFAATGFQAVGLTATASTSVLAGTAATSNGLIISITASFEAGTAAAANGANLAIAAVFAPGDAIAPITGLDFTITATFAPGTASIPGQADYWGDMSVQLYSWESLAYIEWWGN